MYRAAERKRDADKGPSREADKVESLVPYVLRGVFDENGLDLEFYKEAIKRFDDDENIPALFTDVMVQISTRLSRMSMEDDYKPYISVSPPSSHWPGSAVGY